MVNPALGIKYVKRAQIQGGSYHFSIESILADYDIELWIQLLGFGQQIETFNRFIVKVYPEQSGTDFCGLFHSPGAVLLGDGCNVP